MEKQIHKNRFSFAANEFTEILIYCNGDCIFFLFLSDSTRRVVHEKPAVSEIRYEKPGKQDYIPYPMN